MKTRIIDTNPHLKNEDDRREAIMRSVVASSRIEGIEISPAKQEEIAKKVEKHLKESAR